MKTIIVGFDAFDPTRFEKLKAAGALPHLSQMADEGRYRRFEVANPPQSEVSWTSIATGLDPGGHGIFDFVHRDPASYGLQISLLPMRSSLVGTQFVPPHNARTLFDQAVDDGYPAVSMWWPATFPARIESPVQTFPGLGAPDIAGRLGVGAYFAVDDDRPAEDPKTPWQPLNPQHGNTFRGELPGPAMKTRSGPRPSVLDLELETEGETARLRIAGRELSLQAGRWSEFVELQFKLGFLVKVRAITRFLLTRGGDSPRLYALPLQPHPLKSPWRYASPPGFVRRIWQRHGPFLTIGWPQDTTALEDGLIDDPAFLDLCDSIFKRRQAIFFDQLKDFKEGVFATVFDTLDRVQHMFWRDRPDVIDSWYRRLDAFAGEILERAPQGARVLFVSDHGFARLDHKVHLNRWLQEQGYLSAPADAGRLSEVVWPETRLYALGLNSLYVNQNGRESAGIVAESEKAALISEVKARLLGWKGPDGRQVFSRIREGQEIFHGPLTDHGPDLVLGYAAGYRASQETGTGGWGEQALVPNRDHWGADHCMDPEVVPGVLFATSGLQDLSTPSYRDFPELALGRPFATRGGDASQPASTEDEDAVEERLKGLGYL